MSLNLSVVRILITDSNSSISKQILHFNEKHGGTIFHEIHFNLIASQAFGTVLSYFLAFLNNELIGFCPCHSQRIGLLIHSASNLSSYEIPYGGWVYDTKAISIQSLVSHTKLRFFEGLDVSTNIELNVGEYSLLSAIKLKAHKTVVMKLTGSSESDLFSGLSSDQRRKIRRSAKIGVEVECVSGKSFGLFLDLFSELKERTGLPVREAKFYQNVFDHYSPINQAYCVAAKYNGEYVSAIISLANTNYSVAWIAGRKSDMPNNLYQNELLIWESIKWSLSQGCTYFDLSGLDEVNLPHLARIKLSFSHDIKSFYSYSIKSISYRVASRIAKGR